MPYNFSAFGVLPPLWSSAAMKPSPRRIFSNCSRFMIPSWSVALRPGRNRTAAAPVYPAHASRLPVLTPIGKGIAQDRPELRRQAHALAVVALERFDLGARARPAQDVEQRADGGEVEEVVGRDQLVRL